MSDGCQHCECHECCDCGMPNRQFVARLGDATVCPRYPAKYEREQAEERRIEALLQRMNADADKHNRLCDVVADVMRRLDAALRRIEQLELEVARLKGPRHVQPQYDRYRCARCEFEYPTGKDLAEHQCHRASPATAYPPLPDEGT